MEQFDHDRKIFCPHCGTEYKFEPCDGGEDLVTYWGESNAVEIECLNEDCEKTFFVTEHVNRTFCAGFTENRVLENEGEATFEKRRGE